MLVTYATKMGATASIAAAVVGSAIYQRRCLADLAALAIIVGIAALLWLLLAALGKGLELIDTNVSTTAWFGLYGVAIVEGVVGYIAGYRPLWIACAIGLGLMLLVGWILGR